MLNPEGRHGKLRLDKNEHITGLPEQLVHDALSNVNPETISSYPEVRPLYQKLAKSLKISEENLMLSAGSDPAIKSLYELFVKEGDNVILQKPTYAMFHVYAEMFGAMSINIEYDSKLNFDTDLLLNKISDEVQMIAIANPNSPTGTVIEENLLEDIIKKAAKSGGGVLIDEAYYPFYEETMISYINHYENLVISRTFSKAYSLAGLRLGWGYASNFLINMIKKLRPPFNLPPGAIAAGIAALNDESHLQKVVSHNSSIKSWFVDELNNLGFKAYNTQANFVFIIIPENKNQTASLINDHLLSKGIAVRYLLSYGIENALRITLGTKEELNKTIEMLKEFIRNND